MLNVIKIVCVIIGTIIGAGFASGREIFIFFSQYGFCGLIGVLISSIFTGIIIYKVLSLLRNKKVENYNDFLKMLKLPNNINCIINIIINIFLLISFYIMVAGFCAYFKQELNIQPLLMGIIIGILCYITFLNKMDGVMKINTLMIPCIVIMICIIGAKSELVNMQLYCEKISRANWLLASLEYASYNSIILIPILIGISKNSYKQEKVISIIVTIIIGLLSTILYFILINLNVDLTNIELPLIYAVSKLGKIYSYIYGIVIVLAIFTSAISAGYGFLQNCSKTKKGYKKLAMIICISAIFISSIGFSNLVDLLYPVFGIIGLVQIIIILTKNKQSIEK